MSSELTALEGTPAASGQMRLAISEAGGDGRSVLGIITVGKDAEGRLAVSGAADTDDNAAKLRAVLEQHKGAGAANDAKDLAEAFQQAGYQVETLPSGDLQINLQLDLDSGDVIGTHQAMHALAAPNNKLARDVRDAIARHFRDATNDIAEQITGYLANDDTEAAIAAIRNGQEGGAFALPIGSKLLAALMAIDVSDISSDDRRLVRELRMAIAHRLKRFDIAGAEGEAFLAEFKATLTKDQIIDLQILSGLAAEVKGNRETALLIWRGILREPLLSAEQRGWTHRNISMALGVKNREGLQATKMSADAFLEAGNKKEAGRSLMALARGLLFTEPAEAINTIGEILTLLDREGLSDRHLRAAALHTRAHRLLDLGRHQEALRDAQEAIDLRRGLLGVENEYVSSLHLAALAASRSGANDLATAFETEAEKITNDLDLPHFQLAKRLVALGKDFDAETAANLVRDAEAAGVRDVAAAVPIFEAMANPDLSDAGRLNILEDTLKKLDFSRGRNPVEQPLRLAIASRLLKINHPERAELQYRDLLDRYPLDIAARNGLVHCLFAQEKWREAAQVFQREIQLRGELPGLLLGYGKSLFEAGEINAALPVLTRAKDLAGDNETLRKDALDLRELALQLGGSLEPIVERKDSAAPVRREEFEYALSAFASFIKQNKRMRFWTAIKEPPGHEWIEQPEGRAQDLLHGWLKAVFGDRVQAFAELAVGAGRIDLLVQFGGGLKIVIELKMCGYGYSSTYAAEGEGQILHYLDNSDTHLGYLVVFDARLEEYGKTLFEAPSSANTIITHFIDVRPRTSRKKNRKVRSTSGGKDIGK